MSRSVVSGVFLCVILSGGLLWSQESSNWQQVGVLVSDTSAGESMLKVEWTGQPTPGGAVMIRDRDDNASEVGNVRHIYGEYLILQEHLGNDFLAGSLVYQ